MSFNFSHISHNLREATGKIITLGHLQELLAAALGYRTFASYQASNEPSTFDDVSYIILQIDLLEARLKQLQYSDPDAVNFIKNAISQSFQAFNVKTYLSDEDFFDDLQNGIIEEIESSHEYNDAVSSTNAYGGGETSISFNEHPDNETNLDVWKLNVKGTSSLEQDIDRPYCGNIIDVYTEVSFLRLGKCMFGSIEYENIGAQVQAEPGETDPEDYWEEQEIERRIEEKEIEDLIEAQDNALLTPEQLEKKIVFNQRLKESYAKYHKKEYEKLLLDIAKNEIINNLK